MKTLPNADLHPHSPIMQAFLDCTISNFHSACHYIHQLPYGRTSERAHWWLVLKEQQGACSSKHALLKALADELHLPIRLMIGIYAMDETNTQGVGAVLAEHQLQAIPEAHCYLEHAG